MMQLLRHDAETGHATGFGRTRDGSASGWVIALLLAALLVPIVQLVVGVSMAGINRAYDGNFAVSTLVQFQDEWRAGHLPPSWSPQAFGGLGSPVFLFYPPGSYLVTGLLGSLLPGVPAAGVVAVAQILFRAGAMLTCFVWLRRRTTDAAALAGCALYALMPWVCLINPQVRLAFAECAAAALVPLVFLAIDAGRGRAALTICLVAISICSLTFVHLPTMVVTACLGVVYAAMSAASWRGGLRSAIFTCFGVLLGFGLAASFLLPAIGLLPAVSPLTLWDAKHQPEGHFILGLNTLHRSGLLTNMGLLVPAGLVVFFCGAGRASIRSLQGMAAAFAVAVLMAIPLSAPVWAFVRPIRVVMFPGRFLMPASLLAAGLIALVLPALRPALQRLALLAGFCLSVASIVTSVQLGDRMSPAAVRTQQALAHHGDAPEYVPAAAGAHGWVRLAQQGGDMQARAAGFASSCLRKPQRMVPQTEAGLHFGIGGCNGRIVLPQFYFPGWVADADGHALPVTVDPASGLVQTDVPPGAGSLTLHRSRLGIQWLGLAFSVVSLAIWLAVMRAARRGFR